MIAADVGVWGEVRAGGRDRVRTGGWGRTKKCWAEGHFGLWELVTWNLCTCGGGANAWFRWIDPRYKVWRQ